VIQKSGTVGAEINKTQNELSFYTRKKEIVINGQADANTRFELYNIEGKCWYNSKAQSGNINSINAIAFPSGIYLLKISKKGGVQTSKLVLTAN